MGSRKLSPEAAMAARQHSWKDDQIKRKEDEAMARIREAAGKGQKKGKKGEQKVFLTNEQGKRVEVLRGADKYDVFTSDENENSQKAA